MANNGLRGIDVSYYDGGADNQGNPAKNLIDWNAYAKGGNYYAFIKVSQALFVDPLFSLQWEAARGYIYRGGYHLFDPTVDIARSCDNFIAYLGNDRGELPPVFDLELRRDVPGRTVSQYALTWLRRYTNKTGVKPIIYSGTWFLRDQIYAHEFPEFSDYELWLAQYYYDNQSEPARSEKISRVWNGIDSIAFPAAPLPWTEVDWFQYTGLGNPKEIPGYYLGYGSKKAVDFDLSICKTLPELKIRYNLSDLPGLPTDPPAPPTDDKASQTYKGVTTIEGMRNGIKFFIDILDMSKVNLNVLHGSPRAKPSELAKAYEAQLAYNGDDWVIADNSPAGYAVSYGVVFKKKQSGEPSLYILTDGSYGIDTQTTQDVYFASSGVRYIVENGKIVDRVLGTDPTSTERHARKLVGLRADNRVMQFVCEGDYVYTGMQFKEAAQIMIDYGCYVAFDGGGGGDVMRVKDGQLTILPDDEYNGVHYERAVPQTILVFAQENGDIGMLPYYEYTATGNRAIRQGAGVNYPRIASHSDLLKGKIAYGEATDADRYTLTANDPSVQSGIAYAGDVWVKVYENDGIPVDGWTALIHKGQPQLVEVLINPPIDPPPTPDPDYPPATMENEIKLPLADGTYKIYRGTLTRVDPPNA